MHTPVESRSCSAGRTRPSGATLTWHHLHRHGAGRGTVVRLPGEIGRCRAHLPRHERCCIPSVAPLLRMHRRSHNPTPIRVDRVGIAPTSSAAPTRPPAGRPGRRNPSNSPVDQPKIKSAASPANRRGSCTPFTSRKALATRPESMRSCGRFATRRPNPSLKRSANGRPPGPGWWYAVHFHQPGPGVLPSSPS
jgi:hypothetical protein